jgi:hypothetical protein
MGHIYCMTFWIVTAFSSWVAGVTGCRRFGRGCCPHTLMRSNQFGFSFAQGSWRISIFRWGTVYWMSVFLYSKNSSIEAMKIRIYPIKALNPRNSTPPTFLRGSHRIAPNRVPLIFYSLPGFCSPSWGFVPWNHPTSRFVWDSVQAASLTVFSVL